MASKKREDSDLQKNNPENTESSVPTRRKVLKNLAVGSTVIGGVVTGSKWVKPIVDKVVVPAHAQTSATTTPAPAGPTTTLDPCADPASGTKTYESKGVFTVPDCITEITVEVNGAGGGGGGYGKGPCTKGVPNVKYGGDGEQVATKFSVTPGKSYEVTIGYGGYGTNTKNKKNSGGAGYNEGFSGNKNYFNKVDKKCTWYTYGGGGGSSYFNGVEASGGGGGGYKKGGGKGGGPNGGTSNKDGGGGGGGTGGAFGVDGAIGSVVISY